MNDYSKMTENELDRQKKIAELVKIESEIKHLNKPFLLRPAAWSLLIPLLTSLIGWGITYFNLNESEGKLSLSEQAKQSEVGFSGALQVQLDSVRNSISQFIVYDTIQDPTRNKELERRLLSTVKATYIQFKGGIDRAMITSLRNRLNTEGFPTPLPEEVEVDFRNEIRYYYDTDLEAAKNILGVTESFFQANNCNIRLDLKKLDAEKWNVQRGVIEIWINDNCVN